MKKLLKIKGEVSLSYFCGCVEKSDLSGLIARDLRFFQAPQKEPKRQAAGGVKW